MPSSYLRVLVALASALVLAFAAHAAPASAATPPAGMFGLGDWSWPTTTTLDRERAKGLKNWRVAVDWGVVGKVQGAYDFSGYDWLVDNAARRGIRILPVLTGCPAWSCPSGGPPAGGQALTDWKAFVAAAVRRYGTGGSYWTAHPSVPAVPVDAWQVLNEVNGAGAWPSPSPAAYAPFLASTAASIRGADAQSKVVLAGLPEKMDVWMKDYLAGLYQQPGFKASFDVLAIHGYTAAAADVPAIADTARRIMVNAGDGAKPLWITEMSWSTGGPAFPFTTSEAQQKANLEASWDTLTACRARWNLQRVYWYGWKDRDPGTTLDYWGYHTGLQRLNGYAKPAMYAADAYTSGQPLPAGRADTCTLAGGTALELTVPDTTVSGPPARTNDRRPAFRFGSTKASVTYQCHFAGQGWATCAPGLDGLWRPAADLAGGQQWLDVRAVDAQGNVDATPAESSFVLDLTPPDTYVSGTWGNVTSHTVSLTLSANEPVTRYECRVDAGAWATCPSAYTTTLPSGAHTISVRSYDVAGNVDPDPAGPWYQVPA